MQPTSQDHSHAPYAVNENHGENLMGSVESLSPSELDKALNETLNIDKNRSGFAKLCAGKNEKIL